MKCEVLIFSNLKKIEQGINDWLNSNPNIKINNTSMAHGGNRIIVLIFYE